MTKKTLLFGVFLCGNILAFSQIGINTPNPQAALHIDGAKDNPATGNPSVAQQTNDFVVTSGGSVGIGTTAPDSNAALDVKSTTKGIKLPSVSLLATNNPSPLTAHVGGMIVYNTVTAGAEPNNVIAGIYLNDGTKWVHLETSADVVPPGSVFYRASNTVPSGYLECNGEAVSRITYASLFAVIGATYGAGDGSTTFNLPDLRGEFVRGWDHGRGIDADRNIGQWQKGSFIAGAAGPNPDGIIPFANATSAVQIPAIAANLGWDLLSNTIYTNNYSTIQLQNSSTSAGLSLTTPSTTGGDYAYGIARPRNTALMPVIKY
ncbi:phage tail protein [Chryseobacterium kwangjuense]|uniref:Phage tail collar domain-containing protein n=1 Tax=Chryseobacterium kwangjuense TaxID=267125 RepID=A0A135WED4_9FLAO|nr:phage tail protein [Chryseobacterium kwangjuense]KXH83257.1 hypothetical protein AU378_12640 [Chryseobacterium kwangjuense]